MLHPQHSKSPVTCHVFFDYTQGMANSRNILIAVMGVIGTRNSTFIRRATGSNTKVGYGLHACSYFPSHLILRKYQTQNSSGTQTIEVVKFQHLGYTIYFIDTPGFDHTENPDTEIFEHLTAWHQFTYDYSALAPGTYTFTDSPIAVSPVAL